MVSLLLFVFAGLTVILITGLFVCVVVKWLPNSTDGLVYFKRGKIWYADSTGVYFVRSKYGPEILRIFIKRPIQNAIVDSSGLVWCGNLCLGNVKQKLSINFHKRDNKPS